MRFLVLKMSGFILSFLLPAVLIAQHEPFTTNGYDSYMPEVRRWNKILTIFPKLDITTPKGLAHARIVYGPPGGKTILKPQDRFIHGEGGNIRIRIFRPESIRAVVFDIHGGGYFAGRPESTDLLNDVMARFCSVAVVSIEYRLAPENPFEAEVEDCDTVVAWLLQNAKNEFGTDKLILTGFSAGANLAAHTLLDIRDKMHGINRVIGINFFYGMFDESGTPSLRMANSHSLIIDSAIINQIGRIVFKGKSAEELRSAYYSPLYADLKGLPPAFFSVGTIDPLMDDNTFMANRWEAAGNQATLYVYPECPHGFNLFPSQIAKLGNQRVNDWINGLLK
jgi:acetyl esterase/lipase